MNEYRFNVIAEKDGTRFGFNKTYWGLSQSDAHKALTVLLVARGWRVIDISIEKVSA